MLSTTLIALSLLPVAFAHIQVEYPPNRGFEDAQQGSFPCGGFDTPKTPRTNFPISGGPIQINMGHSQSNVAIYLAIGDNPGSAFNYVLRPQFAEEGPGDFCAGMVSIPANLNVTDGTPATIQVVTNAHEEGGLYQCADVTLVNTPLSESEYNDNCKNGTGVKVTQENISGNPNGTSDGHTDHDHSPSGTSAGGATSPSSTGAASHATAVPWVLGAAGVAGMVFL